MIAPAISMISLLSVGPVSATPDDNIVRGKETAYTQDSDARPPWVEYAVGSRPPIIASRTVGSGKVVIAGISSSCRNGRWNSTYLPENYRKLDVLLDKAFQWIVPGATKVLWYGGDGTFGTLENEYNVYNHVGRCSELIATLKNKGYTVDNTIDGTFTSITSALASKDPDILVIPQMELGDKGTGGDPSLLPDWEVESIYDFVAVQGKGLLIMEGNDTFGYNYERVQNKVLRRLDTGIYFQSDVVLDDVNHWPSIPGDYQWQIYADVANVDFGADYRVATGMENIGLYNVCSLALKENYEVAIAILPPYREGFPGGMLIYTATIRNAGWKPDNYTLSILDNIWPVTLSQTTFSNVENGTSRTVTLTVNISSGAFIGDNNQITFRVTGDSGKIVDKKFMATAANRIKPAWEDVFVQEGDPDRNFGTWAKYVWGYVGNSTTDYKDERTWIKFDLRAIPSPVSIKPGNWSADNLQARLFVSCSYTSGTVGENVRCYMVDDDTWTETGITWNNQPYFNPNENFGTTTVTREDYWYSWDVTSLIREKLKRVPRENFASFCLRAETEGAAYPDNFYYSFDMMNLSDNTWHAYIIIGYDVSTWIDPSREEGMPSGTLKYRVNVWNRGSFVDNFNLAVVENQWQATLDTATFSNVQPMEIRTATLSVKVPDGATPDVDNDNIWVRATSTGYTAENDNGRTVAQASSRITPVDDTTTRGRTHLENSFQGDASSIYLGRYLDGPERGWLKFDLNAIGTGMSIARAYLKLYCYDNIGMGTTLRVYGVGDSWNQDNLNWFNQQTALGSPLDSVVVIENRRWYSFDVTSFVLSENAGDKVASFCVVDLGENVAPDHYALMESKEWDNVSLWPYLEILSAAPENEVRVYVNPTFQGDRGGRVDNYIITVSNKSTSGRTYNLIIENTETWPWTLDNSSLTIPAGENRTTILHVTVPSGAAVCTFNRITITAKSALNPSENDVTICYAHRGEVDFDLKYISLYKLRANFKLRVRDNSGGLVMYFYGYDNVRENAALPPATVWNITPYYLDNDVVGAIDIPHVGGIGVKKAKLFLVDTAGIPISKVKGWVIVRDDLWTRIMGIRGEWPYASVPLRDNLWKELMAIRGQWPYAPTSRDPVWVG